MISVFCVYNDRRKIESFLLPSLENQNVSYDLHLLDNRRGQYASAAEAYNQAVDEGAGDYYMFVHQDVSWDSPGFLSSVESLMRAEPCPGVAGAAGRRAGDKRTRTRMTHGPLRRPAGLDSRQRHQYPSFSGWDKANQARDPD